MVEENAPELVQMRDAMLSKIQTDKGCVALNVEELVELDQSLASEWDVDFRTSDSFWPYLATAGDQAAIARFERAFQKVASGQKSEDDSDLYSAMAHAEIIGPVTSHRRHLILDLTAMAIGLYRHLGLSGNILDAGCHVGIMSSLLAARLGKHVVGIDPSANAISFGKSHAARHSSVNLIEASIPWHTHIRFDMVISGSALPDGKNWEVTAAHLRNLGTLLSQGGVALIMSADLAEADPDRMRRTLRTAELGFGYADVAGGYGGLPPKFDAEGIVVLLKGGKREFPRKVKLAMESEWDFFKEYSNTPGRPTREKTQAFERACRHRT